MRTQKGEAHPRAVLGMILIVLAVLLFLNNIGFTFFGAIFSHWPLAMIAIGAYLIYAARRNGLSGKSAGVLPYVLITVGILAALGKYGFLRLSLGVLLVPLALFFVGLHLFRSHSATCRREKNPSDQKLNILADLSGDESASPKPTTAQPTQDNRIDVFTLLGGGNYSTRSNDLVNGNIVCILGGAEIDIREADTRLDEIQLDVLAFMGGVELKIPPNWQVSVKAVPFLGGISNRTTCLAEKMGLPKRHLVITGMACMGGIEIRN
jgi:hypothetical protein